MNHRSGSSSVRSVVRALGLCHYPPTRPTASVACHHLTQELHHMFSLLFDDSKFLADLPVVQFAGRYRVKPASRCTVRHWPRRCARMVASNDSPRLPTVIPNSMNRKRGIAASCEPCRYSRKTTDVGVPGYYQKRTDPQSRPICEADR